MALPDACPDPSRLRRLLDGALPTDEQTELTGHLDTCTDCQQTLEGLAAESLPAADVAKLLAGEKAPPGPALRRVMAELKGETSEAATQAGPTPPGAADLGFLDPPEQPGHLGRLGPYAVTALIGRGGMGVVLRAFDASLHRDVAIKVMAPHLAADDTARQRFLREARAAAAVVHPHVVTIHAVGEHNGLPYLVMEYVSRSSLQALLNRGGPLELCDILRVGAQTAAGLAAAHARGLIHRDIKPGNLLLAPAGPNPDRWAVKITDFGLARAAGVSGLSREGAVAGTPDYMAPEQARGRELDHRADLFALGSVLYALCTGRVPFPADAQLAVLYMVCQETSRPIRETNPAVPDWLVRVVEKLHAKDAAARFQSAAEVAELLARHLASLEHPSPVPPHLWHLIGFEYRTRRTLWGLPLVHLATGWDPETGRKRIAKGVLAVGDVAVGVVAVGAVAAGGVAAGGIALGLAALGGAAVGVLLAVGGLAVGLVAVGGLAVGYHAVGGMAFGVHALGDNLPAGPSG